MKENVPIRPGTQNDSCKRLSNDELEVRFDNGDIVIVDHIICVTGYKVNIDNVPVLSAGNILSTLAIENNFPVLNEYFETNLPGLFITNMAAVQKFGPFFGFTIAVRASAKLIGKSLMKSISLTP